MQVRMQLSLPREARYIALLRNVAQCVLDEFEAPGDDAADIKLAITEACANVVRHAVDSGDYTVAIVMGSEECQIEVADLGPGFDPPNLDEQQPAPGEESGRGLALMRALVDELQFLRDNKATKVVLVKRWSYPVGVPLSVPEPAGV